MEDQFLKEFNIAILHFLKKNWYDFLMILVDVLLFKDPDLVLFVDPDLGG